MNIYVSKIKYFIANYNWINYSLGKDDWKKIEKNNPTIVFNVLYNDNRNFYMVLRKYVLPTFENATQST